MSFIRKFKRLRLSSNNVRNKAQVPESTKIELGGSSRQHSLASNPNLYDVRTAVASTSEPIVHIEANVVIIHDSTVRKHSWTHQNGTFWPRDLLPHSFPEAQIFVFECILSGLIDESNAGIDDIASRLLDLLEEQKKRLPVVFICYSLSGTFAKQVVNIAQDRNPRVAQRISGILFLGTPHRSSETAALSALIGNIASATFPEPLWAKAVRDLENIAERCAKINEVFMQKGIGLQTASCFELKATPPMGSIIVDKASSRIGLEEAQQIPLSANHLQMSQFESAESENYATVVTALKGLLSWSRARSRHNDGLKLPSSNPKDLLEPQQPSTTLQNHSNSVAMQGSQHFYGNPTFNFFTSDTKRGQTSEPADSPSNKSFDESELSFLASLRPESMFGSEYRVDTKLHGTLEWLPQDAVYNSWFLAQSNLVLLITGYPGYGKSVLASHVRKQLHSLKPQDLICGYFFDGTVPERNEAKCVLRSLIVQIVAQRRKLLKLIRKAENNAVLQGEPLKANLPALWSLFVTLVTHKRTKEICIIMDAIDECSQRTQRYLMENILGCLRCETPAPVKFLITSRPEALALTVVGSSPSYFLQLRLEQKQQAVSNDIELLIRERFDNFVQSGQCHPEAREGFEKALSAAAEGSFLWVSLTLTLLEERRLIKAKDITPICEQAPSDLKKMYGRLLDRIPSSDRDLADRMLMTILVCFRPPTVDELKIILAIEPFHRSVKDVEQAYSISGAKSILGLLAGLVKIIDDHVYLVHYTLKDYLVTSYRAKFGNTGCDSDLSGHRMMAKTCMHYLLLKEIQNDGRESVTTSPSPTSPAATFTSIQKSKNDDEDGDSQIISFDNIFKTEDEVREEASRLTAHRYGLYDYSARYWAVHLAQCQDNDDVELIDNATLLCSDESNRGWYDYLAAIGNEFNAYPFQPDKLTLSAFLGHHVSVTRLIAAGVDATWTGSALFWAAHSGHTECVQILLSTSPPTKQLFYPQELYHRGLSALAIASLNGHYNCVDAILADGSSNVNQQDQSGRSPLSLAAGAGQGEVVSRLLEQKDLNANLPDHKGSSPLIWAAGSNSLQVISLLCGYKGTGIGHEDNTRRDALSWACAFGFSEAVKVLIDVISARVNVKDTCGRTPLIYAVQSKDMKTVREIARCPDIDASVQDDKGRNAISWAASIRDTSILKYLLKRFPITADTADEMMWTPLAWTLNGPGYVENARALLKHNIGNFNTKDASGTPITILALQWSSPDIAELLVSRDNIDINAVDARGRSVLACAAATGRVQLVGLILKRKEVDCDLVGKDGMTAATLAKQNGHEEIYRIIREYSR